MVVLTHSLHGLTIGTYILHDGFHHRGVHDVCIILTDLLGARLGQESLDALGSGEDGLGVDLLGESVDVALEFLVDDAIDFRQFIGLEGVLVDLQHLGKGLLLHLRVGLGEELVHIHLLEHHQCHGFGILVLVHVGLIVGTELCSDASGTHVGNKVGIIDILSHIAKALVGLFQVRQGVLIFGLVVLVHPVGEVFLQGDLALADLVLAEHLALADEVLPSVG